MKSEFLHQFHRNHRMARRTRLLADIAPLAERGCRFAPLSNWLLRSYPLRWLNERLFGLDRRRVPPAFARETFQQWWERHEEPDSTPSFAIFPDTFTNYYEPRQGIAAVQVARTFGAGVTLAPRVCCGRPLISKGLLHEAALRAEETTRALSPLVHQGLPIVFCEPSCFSALRDDLPRLLRGELRDEAERVAAACLTFEEWAENWLAAHSDVLATVVKQGPRRILLHAHCHQKALVGVAPTQKLLARLPDCQVDVLDSGCCGMAGSFGYESEHYDISAVIAERRLIPAIRSSDAETIVVAPGFSCRHQIKHFSGTDSISPAELLASLMED